MELQIKTGDREIDAGCELAIRTLRMNVSEKWGKLCAVVAPAWGQGYPAWIHSFDNFWMNKVTPYLFPRTFVEWPIELLFRYQWPSGMTEGGIHDCDGPEDYQKYLAGKGETWIREQSINNPYLRDHLYIMQVRDLWWHYGDIEIARRFLPSCRKALAYMYTLKDDDGDGLVETSDVLEDVGIGEAGGRSGAKAVERFVDQSLLFGALLDYVRMAEALGEKEEAESARTRQAALARKVNELFWDEKGYYRFAVDSKTHEPVHAETASTYGNGYAVLWGLVPSDRVNRLLDYFAGWQFEVPGPIVLPPMQLPIRTEQQRMLYGPGYYANGGCGWGRGYLPSFCLADFASGREELATRYLRQMAKAAAKAGAFHEWWTWGKYTGSTEPQGCRDYSETTSAYLDSVIHGFFGLSATEPGWRSLRLSPHPIPGRPCSISLELPGGPFTAVVDRSGKAWTVKLRSEVGRTVEVAVSGASPVRVAVKGEQTLRL